MMYRLGHKRRTPKELFTLLRQKVAGHFNSKSDLIPQQPSHADVIFTGDLIFRSKNQKIDYGDPSISQEELDQIYHPYLQYDFPLQTYKITLDNHLLTPLRHQNFFQFSQTQLKGKLIKCIHSSSEYISVGWSNSIVMVFRLDNVKKIMWIRLPEKVSISHVFIIDSNIVVCDENQKMYLLEIVHDQIKVVYEYQHLGSKVDMMLAIRVPDAIVLFFSDSEGKLYRLTFKKILLIQTSSIKLIYNGNQSLVFTLLNPYLSQKYQTNKVDTTVMMGVNNSISCTILSLSLATDECQVLFQFDNFVNFQPKTFDPEYKSVEFMQYQSDGEQSLMLASSFGSRLFFTNITVNKESKKVEYRNTQRVRCKGNIITIKHVSGMKYLIVTSTIIYYCLTTNTTRFDLFTNLSQFKTVSIKISTPLPNSLEKITYIKQKLVWVSDNRVECCHVLNWQQLYNTISSGEALYLLYFLIVSKYVHSSYLQKPSSFKTLQSSFPSSTIEQKQLLLQYYYLMNQIPPDTVACSDQLSQLLLPFIFNHQLDNLSNSQLENLVKYWEQHQVLMVQEIIMSGIDKGWDIAIKNAWMRALMKIAKMRDDFQLPLLKMCGYFIQNENNEELAGKYAGQIIKYMSLGINKNLEQIDDEQEFDDMIKIFVKVLLDQEMYLRLSKQKAKKVISVFTDLFRGESLNCIVKMQLEGFILDCTVKYSPLVLEKNSVEEIIYSHCIGTLWNNHSLEIQKNLISQQAVLLADGHFSFERERIFELITRLIADEELSIKATKIQHKPNQLETDDLDIKSQQLILYLIRLLKSKHNPSNSQLNELLQLAQKSRNLELVSIDLMKPQKRYESILLKYVYSNKPKIKEKVFDWLEEITKRLLEEQSIESEAMKDFNRIVLNKMKELIHINKEKTREYIQTYFKNSEKKLIHRIQNDPQLQLQYVQLVLQNQILPDQELLNLHINLLCRLNPPRIIQVVEATSNKYDLDSVLEICEKYSKMDSVVIYLYEKTGEAEKAVAKHLELFYQEWQTMKKQRMEFLNRKYQVMQSQASGGESSPQRRVNTLVDNKTENFLKEITLHLEHIMSIIHKQFSQLEYFRMVTNLMSRIYALEEQELEATRSEDHTFVDKLTELLGIVIMDLAREGHIDFLIDDVLGKYKTMSLREMKKHIKDIYSCMLSSRTVIENILEINRDYLLDLNVFTRTSVSKSNGALGSCALCQISIMDNQTALLFTCGHLYHLGCEESQDEVDYCTECIYSDVINGMIENPDVSLQKLLLNRESKLRYRNVSMTKEEIETKKRIDMAQSRKKTKMGIFDKKVSELAIQAEIIQLRLQSKMYRG